MIGDTDADKDILRRLDPDHDHRERPVRLGALRRVYAAAKRSYAPSAARRLRCTSARVRATTSSGSVGGGLFLSQPVVSSQSRTNCLSNDGCGAPGRYWSAGQKRELSGVSTSSIRMSRPSCQPHSNLVSAMMMPLVARMLGGPLIDVDRAPPQLVGCFAADDLDHPLEGDVDVVTALFFGRRREDRLRQTASIARGPRQCSPQTVPLWRYSFQPEPSR